MSDVEEPTADVLVLLQDRAKLQKIKDSKKKYRRSKKGREAQKRAMRKYLEKKKSEKLKEIK